MTSVDDPPVEPTCGREWNSDPSRTCAARPVSGTVLCLAHHPRHHRADLLIDAATYGEIDLAHAEIDRQLVHDLRAVLARSVTSTDLQIPRSIALNARDATFIHNAWFQGTTFTGETDFDRVTFAGDAWFQEATFCDRAVFTGASFTGPAKFAKATFTADAWFARATFWGPAEFESSKFDGYAQFEDASFIGRADFTGASFARNAWFAKASFIDIARFERAMFADDNAFFVAARFHDLAWFRDATFTGEAMFAEAMFAKTARFEAAAFRGDVRFRGARFNGDARFDDATFAGDAWFGDVTFTGEAKFVGATLGRALRIDNGPGDNAIDLTALRLSGAATIELTGAWQLTLDRVVLREPLTIVAATARRAAVVSMTDATVLAPLIVGTGVTLTDSALAGTTGLDQLRLRTDPAWQQWRHRRTLADERTARHQPPPTYPQVESLYRQLRVGLEASKAAPAAADFYYGELEMRRLHAGWSLEGILLGVYKVVGGYGVRAWRPLVAYLTLVAGTAGALRLWPLALANGTHAVIGGRKLHQYWDAFAYVARNSISLFTAPADELSALGTLLLVLERFAAVSTLALFVLALRSKVHR